MTGQSTSQSITAAAARQAPASSGRRARLGLIRGGRPLKRWRYVGVFNEQLMACAAIVQVGPARQSFWALYLREQDELRERTRLLPRRRALRLLRGSRLGAGDRRPGRLLVSDGGVVLDLSLEEDDGFAARCANGRAHVWTRKQAGIAAHGTLALDGRPPDR